MYRDTGIEIKIELSRQRALVMGELPDLSRHFG